jgi:hypothetical protein
MFLCLTGICQYAVGGIGTGSVMEGKVSLEIVCRDLQRMIREEARSAALKGDVMRCMLWDTAASSLYIWTYFL